MTHPRVLIACIGNIFLGDDAFGVEVARRLAAIEMPEGVRVVDFGIRGIDLTYALTDGYESVILVDAAPRGGAPGTLYVLEPTVDEAPGPEGAGTLLDAHGMDPAKVLRLAAAMGGRVGRLLMVGCEPEACDEPEDLQAGLSGPVRSAVDEGGPPDPVARRAAPRRRGARVGRGRIDPREGGRNMASLTSELGSWLPAPPDDWRHPLARRARRRGPDPRLLIAGAVVVGAGLLTWHYLGPDMKRYLKIHSM